MSMHRAGRTLAVILMTTAIWVTGAVQVSADSSHSIQYGETLSEIAERYGISVDELAISNNIVDFNMIFAGEELFIPSRGGDTGAEAAAPAGVGGVSGDVHYAQPGDTLSDVAVARHISLAQLLAANPEISDPNTIYVDQRIKLPVKLEAGASSTVQAPATVQTSSASVESLLTQHAMAYGLDVSLVKALAWQESGWQQHVVSSAGAMGVMQIMPGTAEWLSSYVVGYPLDVSSSTSDNILAGTAYLRWLIDRTGNVEYALAAYYQGPTSVQNDGFFSDTRAYVTNIMSIRTYLMTYGYPPR